MRSICIMNVKYRPIVCVCGSFFSSFVCRLLISSPHFQWSKTERKLSIRLLFVLLSAQFPSKSYVCVSWNWPTLKTIVFALNLFAVIFKCVIFKFLTYGSEFFFLSLLVLLCFILLPIFFSPEARHDQHVYWILLQLAKRKRPQNAQNENVCFFVCFFFVCVCVNANWRAWIRKWEIFQMLQVTVKPIVFSVCAEYYFCKSFSTWMHFLRSPFSHWKIENICRSVANLNSLFVCMRCAFFCFISFCMILFFVLENLVLHAHPSDLYIKQKKIVCVAKHFVQVSLWQ